MLSSVAFYVNNRAWLLVFCMQAVSSLIPVFAIKYTFHDAKYTRFELPCTTEDETNYYV